MKIKLFLSAVVLGLMVGCSPSTQIVKSWTEPS